MSELLRNNFTMYPKAILRTSLIILNNIYCLPAYVFWMTILLPVKRYNVDLYYRIEGLFFHWLLSVVAMWSYTAGYGVVELGDDITPCRKRNTRTLVVANHQSTADVPLMMTSFNAKPDILPNIMWIMERLFKYTNFGLVSLIHQDFFISSGRENRDESVRSLKDHIVNTFIPRMRSWMVLFPEGGFLHKRREVSRRYAEKNNLPNFNHVTLPRVGALKAIFSVLPPHEAPANNNSPVVPETDSKSELTPNGKATDVAAVTNSSIAGADQAEDDRPNLDYILDITIAYPKGEPLDLPTIITGNRDPFQTYFLYRLYPTAQIPKSEEELTAWLFDRWSEKESILEEFYKFGTFSYPGAMPPTIVQQDMLRFVIINLFFITSSYVQLQLFYALVGYCNSLCIYSTIL